MMTALSISKTITSLLLLSLGLTRSAAAEVGESSSSLSSSSKKIGHLDHFTTPAIAWSNLPDVFLNTEHDNVLADTTTVFDMINAAVSKVDLLYVFMLPQEENSHKFANELGSSPALQKLSTESKSWEYYPFVRASKSFWDVENWNTMAKKKPLDVLILSVDQTLTMLDAWATKSGINHVPQNLRPTANQGASAAIWEEKYPSSNVVLVDVEPLADGNDGDAHYFQLAYQFTSSSNKLSYAAIIIAPRSREVAVKGFPVIDNSSPPAAQAEQAEAEPAQAEPAQAAKDVEQAAGEAAANVGEVPADVQPVTGLVQAADDAPAIEDAQAVVADSEDAEQAEANKRAEEELPAIPDQQQADSDESQEGAVAAQAEEVAIQEAEAAVAADSNALPADALPESIPNEDQADVVDAAAAAEQKAVEDDSSIYQKRAIVARQQLSAANQLRVALRGGAQPILESNGFRRGFSPLRRSLQQQGNNSSSDDRPLEMKPTQISMLMVIVTLFFFVGLGSCCIMAVDTPTLFRDKTLVVNKEY